MVSCCCGLAVKAQEANSWDPGPIPGHNTSFDAPDSSCLFSGPWLHLESRYTGSRGWFEGSSGTPSAGEEEHTTCQKALWHGPLVPCRCGLEVMAQVANSWDPGSFPVTTHLLTSLNLHVSTLAPDSNWKPVTGKLLFYAKVCSKFCKILCFGCFRVLPVLFSCMAVELWLLD